MSTCAECTFIEAAGIYEGKKKRTLQTGEEFWKKRSCRISLTKQRKLEGSNLHLIVTGCTVKVWFCLACFLHSGWSGTPARPCCWREQTTATCGCGRSHPESAKPSRALPARPPPAKSCLMVRGGEGKNTHTNAHNIKKKTFILREKSSGGLRGWNAPRVGFEARKHDSCH